MDPIGCFGFPRASMNIYWAIPRVWLKPVIVYSPVASPVDHSAPHAIPAPTPANQWLRDPHPISDLNPGLPTHAFGTPVPPSNLQLPDLTEEETCLLLNNSFSFGNNFGIGETPFGFNGDGALGLNFGAHPSVPFNVPGFPPVAPIAPVAPPAPMLQIQSPTQPVNTTTSSFATLPDYTNLGSNAPITSWTNPSVPVAIPPPASRPESCATNPGAGTTPARVGHYSAPVSRANTPFHALTSTPRFPNQSPALRTAAHQVQARASTPRASPTGPSPGYQISTASPIIGSRNLFRSSSNPLLSFDHPSVPNTPARHRSSPSQLRAAQFSSVSRHATPFLSTHHSASRSVSPPRTPVATPGSPASCSHGTGCSCDNFNAVQSPRLHRVRTPPPLTRAFNQIAGPIEGADSHALVANISETTPQTFGPEVTTTTNPPAAPTTTEFRARRAKCCDLSREDPIFRLSRTV
ncbi:hypothetical protein FS749_001829 [Ceratobasidium sp. UAMH 11750]|nr:hypothetical protein FS749_001829 [Ceratobasidium sp. UAMH 11750]